MFCIHCGCQLPDSAVFCPSCGNRITNQTPSAQPKPASPHKIPSACPACGSTNLKRLQPGEYVCEFCGSKYYTDEPRPFENTESRDAMVAVLLKEAEEYAAKRDYKNELQTLMKAFSLNPESDTVLLRVGRAYSRLDFPQKALEYYQKAERLYPDDPIVYVNIGTAFMNQGLPKEARPYYEKALSIIERDPASAVIGDIAVSYGSYALCLGRLGDKKNAVKYLAIAEGKGYSQESIKNATVFCA